MTTAADLDRIVDGPGTKADRARALFALGCERTDVVELLNMSYSQAHSIWKETNGADQRRQKPVARSGKSTPTRRVAHHRAASNGTRDHGDYIRVEAPDWESDRPLHLSPAQVRYITQDGHVIVRVDKANGPFCQECERHLTFSLAYLGFIHSDSKGEPTAIEDIYHE